MTNNRFKFRAWDKESDDFPEGCMTYFDIRKGIGDVDLIMQCTSDVDVIMQCTGLKDKNGKLIYEGDIVKKTFGSFTIDLNTGLKSGDEVGIFQIRFNELHCCFGLFKDSGYIDGLLATEYNDKGKRHRDWRSDDIEIIGNIYENPELLNNE